MNYLKELFNGQGGNLVNCDRADRQGFMWIKMHATPTEKLAYGEYQAGRCKWCKIAYKWPVKAKFRLKEAHCPVCGDPLSQTIVHLLKRGYVVDIEKPLGPGAGKRLQNGETP